MRLISNLDFLAILSIPTQGHSGSNPPFFFQNSQSPEWAMAHEWGRPRPQYEIVFRRPNLDIPFYDMHKTLKIAFSLEFQFPNSFMLLQALIVYLNLLNISWL